MKNACSAVLYSILALFLGLAGGTAALGQTRELKSVAQITLDENGRQLSYPSALFYDRREEEIFLVHGGTSRVVVYGPDFFPTASMGAGHGVDRPQGGYVAGSGLIYVCQAPSGAKPARIVVLNSAFIPVREIFFDEIPGVGQFRPHRVTVSRDGLLYVTGEATRGVLVLDQDGTFQRRLEPLDDIFDPSLVSAASLAVGEDGELQTSDAGEISTNGADEVTQPREPASFDIPEEFRPKTQLEREAPSGRAVGPVRVRSVTIDAEGRLYLVSGETSKIYVYDASETFLFSFGEKGGTARKLSQPRSLGIDEKQGLIYVVDYMRHTILVYDRNGKFQFEVGGRGFGPGWFNYPVDIVVTPQGQLIVADLFNRRVQVLEVTLLTGLPFVERRGRSAGAGEESEAKEPPRTVERALPAEDVPEAPPAAPPEVMGEPPPPGVEEEVHLPE